MQNNNNWRNTSPRPEPALPSTGAPGAAVIATLHARADTEKALEIVRLLKNADGKIEVENLGSSDAPIYAIPTDAKPDKLKELGLRCTDEHNHHITAESAQQALAGLIPSVRLYSVEVKAPSFNGTGRENRILKRLTQKAGGISEQQCAGIIAAHNILCGAIGMDTAKTSLSAISSAGK